MIRYIFLTLIVFFTTFLGLQAQSNNLFYGMVIDANNQEAIIGATITIKKSPTPTGTATDIEGKFSIPKFFEKGTMVLEISYIGYETKLVNVSAKDNNIIIPLSAGVEMTAIEVNASELSNFTSTFNPLNIETISSTELKRAACCTLAESFETNATVNVSASDAATGAKEIEMLGLRGTYVQMQIESRPALNRLDRPYGLDLIPGAWIESVQISKGASTVRNGAQSIAGQINVELIKPDNAPKVYLGLFAAHMGRFELNNNYAFKLSDKWSTSLMMFGHYTQENIDHNHDAFLDVPQKKHANIMNRWFYNTDDWHIEFNLHGIYQKMQTGQTPVTVLSTAYHHNNSPSYDIYKIASDIQRYEFFGKVGYLGFKQPNATAAFVYSGTYYDQNMLIGNRTFLGRQKSLYGQGIYQNSIAGSNNHFFISGLSYNYDEFLESFDNLNLNRTEQLIGIYGEYEYNVKFKNNRSFGLIAGVRGDALVVSDKATRYYINPRVNAKYNFSDNTILRASAGRGVRTHNALSENLRYMPSIRHFQIVGELKPEEAWNYGLNFTHNFRVAGKDANVNIDLYRTDFQNQLLSDIDEDLTAVRIYSSTNKSFANSFLISYQQDLFKGFFARIAYKYNEVKSVYNNELQLQPFSPIHRGMLTASYKTPNKKWQFDATLQFTGEQRLPLLSYVDAALPDYRINGKAPAYATLMAQITHYMPKSGFEVYLGAENLTNYKQKNPILYATDPYSNRFDAAAIYAPIMGTMVYVGVRYMPADYVPKKGHNHGHSDAEEKRNLFKNTSEHKHDNTTENISHHDHDGHDHAHDEHHHDDEHNHGDEVDHHAEGHFHTVQIKTSAQCGMCKDKLEHKILNKRGVKNATLDIDTQIFTIDFTHDTDEDALKEAISKLGYDADDVPADEKAYSKLPDCCRKDGGHR